MVAFALQMNEPLSVLEGALDTNDFSVPALIELDFSPQVPSCVPFEIHDNIQETVRKADNMLGIMLKGGSIAKATCHSKVDRALNPEAYAESTIDSKYELAIYRIWKLGVRLRDVDWASYTDKIPHSGSGGKKYVNLAIDLCTMYRRDGVTADQAYSWSQRHRSLMPLLNAITRVRKVHLDICGGVAGRDPRLFVELLAVNEQKSALNRCIHTATNGKRGSWQSLLDDDGWATLRATVDAFTERQQWLRAQLSPISIKPPQYTSCDPLPLSEVPCQNSLSWNVPAGAVVQSQLPRNPSNALANLMAQSHTQDYPPRPYLPEITQKQYWH